MTKVTLHILRNDILETRYGNNKDCAITRALIRAGYPNLIDVGAYIRDKNGIVVINSEDTDYNEMSNKVIRMYNHSGYNDRHGETFKVEPKDFTVTLNLNLVESIFGY